MRKDNELGALRYPNLAIHLPGRIKHLGEPSLLLELAGE
jgi:hypothetical protein